MPYATGSHEHEPQLLVATTMEDWGSKQDDPVKEEEEVGIIVHEVHAEKNPKEELEVKVVEAEAVVVVTSPSPPEPSSDSTTQEQLISNTCTTKSPSPPEPSSERKKEPSSDSTTQEQPSRKTCTGTAMVENRESPSSSASSSTSSLPPRELWQRYLARVREYRTLLLAADEALGHLLFFAPYSDHGGDDAFSSVSRWTEVLFGFMQLSRLSIDLAASSKEGEAAIVTKNPFGASIATCPSGGFPATATRIALTVLQCIWPVAQQLVRSSSNHDRETTARRQARVRCMLERIRFLLRMMLLIQYWKETKKSKQAPGLLLDGGIYYGEADEDKASDSAAHVVPVPTIEQEKARLKRTKYTGRRTGRKVATSAGQQLVRGEKTLHDDDCSPEPNHDNQEEETSSLQSFLPKAVQPYVNITPSLGIMVGEVLAVSRPLVLAEVQARTTNVSTLYKVWLLCLSMDLTSLLTLKQTLSDLDHGSNKSTAAATATTDVVSVADAVLKKLTSPHVDGNQVTQSEWKRRRMRLFLYLLRAPVWDQHTRLVAEGVSNTILGRVPLVGGLMQNYLWDWLYYWKLYRAEEG